jgi:transcriptional regulator with XRE-family HTH domain
MPEQSVSQQVGRRIREARERAKLTQQQLADHVGVTKNTVSEIERGRDTSVALLAQMAQVLGVATADLVHVHEMTPPPAEGASFDYWVGRWEQQTMHFRRLLADQEELLSVMKDRSNLGAVARTTTPVEIARQTASVELFGTAPPSESSRPETGGADLNRPPSPPGSRGARTDPVTT